MAGRDPQSNLPSHSPMILLAAGVIILLACAAITALVIRYFLDASPNSALVLPGTNSDQIVPPIPGAPTAVMGATIGGVVQNETGDPLSNVSVSVNWAKPSPAPGIQGSPPQQYHTTKTTTDAQGRWNVAGVEFNTMRQIVLTRTNYLEMDAAPAHTLLNQSAVFVMSHGVDITGQVVDQNGQPIADAGLSRFPDDVRYPDIVNQVTSDGNGHFVLRHLPAGDTIVTVNAKGFASERVNLSSLANGPPVRIVLSPGILFRGHVADPAGQPIAGADVWAYFWYDMRMPRFRGKTDAQGDIQIPDALPGGMEMQIDKAGYQGQELAVIPDPTRMTFTLQPQPDLNITARVVDAKTRQPISKVTVIPGYRWSNSIAPNFINSRPQSFSGAGIKLALDPFSNEMPEHYLRFEADGYAPWITPSLRGGGDLGEIALQPSADLQGLLLNPDGTPAAEATMNLILFGNPINPSNGQASSGPFNNPPQITDAQGHFHFPSQIGRFEIWATSEAGSASLRADAAINQTIRMQLIPWASLRLHGLSWNSADPALVPQAAQVYSAGDPAEQYYASWSYTLTPDDHGDEIVDRLPPFADGLTLLTLNRVGPFPRSENGPTILTHLTPGQTTDFDFSRGITVVGRVSPKTENDRITHGQGRINLRRHSVKSISQLPPDWPSAAAISPAILNYQSQLDPDGQFRIGSVLPGKYDYSMVIFSNPHSGEYGAGTVDIGPGDAKGTVELGELFYAVYPAPSVGKPGPEMLGRTLDGNPILRADYAGKYIVWAVWHTVFGRNSDPSALADLGKQFGGDSRVIFLGINEDSAEYPLQRRPPSLGGGWIDGYLSLVDQPIAYSLSYQNQPSIFIMAPDGKIAAKDVPIDQTATTLLRLLGKEK